MISVNEAVEIIKKHAPQPEKEKVPLENALGYVLAQDIISPEPSPRFTNSAMDGFAIKYEDTRKINEFHLKGESRAGIPFQDKIENGEAVRINTGGMLPDGTDTIIPIEDVDVEHEKVIIQKEVKPYQHVRYSGEEFEAGARLVKVNTELQPQHLALIASVGISEVSVFKRPAVSIVVTGSELVDVGESAEPHQIWDSNRVMLAAAVKEAGAGVVYQGKVVDDYESTKKVLNEASKKADIIIVSGGVSVGPHDLVKSAVTELGFETLFWKVKQKPGKPFYMAKNGGKLFFGLPGNPVSAFMGFTHYIQPLLKLLQGLEYSHKTTKALVKDDITNKKARTQLMRVKLEKGDKNYPEIIVLDRQGSHMLSSIAEAVGYIIINEKQTINRDDLIEVYLFPGRN